MVKHGWICSWSSSRLPSEEDDDAFRKGSDQLSILTKTNNDGVLDQFGKRRARTRLSGARGLMVDLKPRPS